jgi:hypothetical protein
MELVIRPDDLRAAAAALSACAARLEGAAIRFGRQANHRVFDLGVKSGIAAARAVSETEHGVATLHTDITALARALDTLAQAYPEVDRTAVPPP